MSFGLRNVSDPDAALREFLRVTKPGGRFVLCEFSQPTNKAFRTVYSNYLMRSLPAVARKVSSNPESYVYLAESIQAWPAQRAMAQRIAASGWEGVKWRNLSGGVVALHRATKPLAAAGRRLGRPKFRPRGAVLDSLPFVKTFTSTPGAGLASRPHRVRRTSLPLG